MSLPNVVIARIIAGHQYPPELYFKMMLIGYLYGSRSTRRLVQDIYYNVSYRWFCGLTLKDPILNHASLSRIKKRYSVDIFERFFHAILNQCREKGLLNSHGVMTDSSLFQANASLNSMQPLIEDKENTPKKNWYFSIFQTKYFEQNASKPNRSGCDLGLQSRNNVYFKI